jgi:hypothetical protein
MKNEELISIYKNFSKQTVNIAHEIIRNDISSGMTVSTKGSFDKLFEQMRGYFGNVDFARFNTKELKELGWSIWDDNLILAPTWVLDICNKGTIFTTINGEKVEKVDKLDMDTRFGVTAYGLLLSELRDQKLSDILE